MKTKCLILTTALLVSPALKANKPYIQPPLTWGFISGKDTVTNDGQAYGVANAEQVVTCLNEYQPALRTKIKNEVKKLGMMASLPIKALIKGFGGYDKVTIVNLLKNSPVRKILKLELLTGEDALSEKNSPKGLTKNLSIEKATPSLEKDKYYIMFRGANGFKTLETPTILKCPIEVKATGIACTRVKK